MSEKNAIKEFKITQEHLERGIEEGKLKVQWRSCHGNSYRLYVRNEVADFAKTCPKDEKLVKKGKKDELKATTELLAQAQAQVAALSSKKRELETWMSENDESVKKVKVARVPATAAVSTAAPVAAGTVAAVVPPPSVVKA